MRITKYFIQRINWANYEIMRLNLNREKMIINNIKNKILKLAKQDIYRIEKAIENNLKNEKGIVADAAKYIIFSGGKRLRPLLMILAARLCGYKGKQDDLFSIIFEYLHTATLLHDDIIDGALIRRKKKVANKVWNTKTAILTGDFCWQDHYQ